MKKALVILFDKSEEIEAVSPIDILRRAGVQTLTASMHDRLDVVGRSEIALHCDALFADAKAASYDAVILPGGAGVHAFSGDAALLEFLKKQNDGGGIVAAICAAPIVLDAAGVLENRRCTAHMSVAQRLKNCDSKSSVVVDGNVITSRGAGTAIEFSLAIVEALCGKNAAIEIAASICFNPYMA